MDQVFILLPSGVFHGGNIEKTIEFMQGPGMASLVKFSSKDLDLRNAIPVELNTIDVGIPGDGDRRFRAIVIAIPG